MIVCGIPAFLLVLILPARYRHDNRLIFWFLDKLYKGSVYAVLMPQDIQGSEHIPDEPAIFVGNHQSSLDIPMLGSIIDGRPHIWYALQYYANMPFLGIFIRRLGVPLDRSGASNGAGALRKGMRLASKHKRDIMIFPEGARYTDGTIHPFLRGFAMLARRLERPVIPVFMPNNGNIYPPGALWAHWDKIVVVIGPAFWYTATDTDETFTQRVREWFIKQNEVI
jgi:1-acyl-sn-glycerol-3-phosphate acyltransferase